MPTNVKARGGFVSIKGKYIADLADYYGFEIKVRNKRRENLRITINMTCESMIENDMYQVDAEIIGGGEVSMIRIPFKSFHLTSLGYDREVQRLNDSLQVRSLGFLITSQLQAKKYGTAVYDQMIGDDEEDDDQLEAVRRGKDFEFDLEILEISAITYTEDQGRELEDRKEYLRQRMKQRITNDNNKY